MRLPFIKMEGLGNDYVYVDCFNPETSAMIAGIDLPAITQRISDRHYGIGSDGLVLILPSKDADAKMRIFNADGSEAEMCGNAIRCIGKYLYEHGICTKTHLFIETLSGIRALSLKTIGGIVEEVTVNMGTPVIRPDTMKMNNDHYGFVSVDIGNHHAVFFRNSLQDINQVGTKGKLVSEHSHFPDEVNVEFAYVRNAQEIDVRVWERGTGETLACGTGACAAAVTAIWNGWTDRNLTVHLPGGDLSIRWEVGGSVYMTGPAVEVFSGIYYWEK